MPQSGGPNTVNDSIVFNYDIGDVANSYKGEPTTNYVTNASTFNGGWSSYGNGNDGTFITEFGTTGYQIINRGSWNGIVASFSIPSPGTVSFSAWFKYLGGSPNNNGATVYTSGWGIGYDTAAYVDKSKIGVWQRVVNTQYCPGTSGYFYIISYGGTYGADNSSWQVTMPQIEIKPHATPFVNGTRSTTQGLLDISGRGNTIDLATSYDSNAQPYFDATDDFISLGSDVTFKTTGGWTVESIVYYNSVAGTYNNTTSPANFIGAEAIDYNSWYWSVLENKLALWNISPGVWKYGSTTLQPNTWYYVTLVSFAGGLTYQFYLNGVAEGGDHTTYSWNPSYSGLKIRYIGKGNNANTRLVNGRINMTKVYDRALTSTEIANNYRQYKTRFNLP